jgi:hydroxymethylglutaryl-CoA reductase
MALHARSVAVAAGAIGDQVERVAACIVEARDITLEGAKRALDLLRQASGERKAGVPAFASDLDDA